MKSKYQDEYPMIAEILLGLFSESFSGHSFLQFVYQGPFKGHWAIGFYWEYNQVNYEILRWHRDKDYMQLTEWEESRSKSENSVVLSFSKAKGSTSMVKFGPVLKDVLKLKISPMVRDEVAGRDGSINTLRIGRKENVMNYSWWTAGCPAEWEVLTAISEKIERLKNELQPESTTEISVEWIEAFERKKEMKMVTVQEIG